MRVLILRGNPRKNGYTRYVTDLFAQGLTQTDAHVDDVDIVNRDIKLCTGCYRCWATTPGTCIFRDDMDELLPKFIDADVVVYATPLYYYTMSSSMKRFIERTFPAFKQGFGTTQRGLMKNSPRYPERWPKKVIVIVAGAFKSPEDYRPLLDTFDIMSEGMEMEVTGRIVRPESYLTQFTLAKPKTVKTIETALIRAGMEVGTTGGVSADTEEKARTSLTIDHHHFVKYSRVFWEHCMALGSEATDLDKVQRSVNGDVRILMSEMARSIDPIAAARLVAVLQFDFPDKDQHFRLTVNRGACTLTEELTDEPDLRVTASTVAWARVFTRQITMKDALMSREVLLRGDKSLFSRLDRYFPPPVS